MGNKGFVPERLAFLPPAGGIRLGRPAALNESRHGRKGDQAGPLVKLFMKTLTSIACLSRFQARPRPGPPGRCEPGGGARGGPEGSSAKTQIGWRETTRG